MNRFGSLLPLATAALISACTPNESDRGAQMAETATRLREQQGTRAVRLVSGTGQRVKFFLAGSACYISDLYPVDQVSSDVVARHRDLLSPNGELIRLAKLTRPEECNIRG